jgi:hypothetical protein
VLGPFDYTIWIVSFLLEFAVVACALYRGEFLHYLCLNLYMLCAAAQEATEFLCFLKYGIHSKQYFFIYYYTNSLMAILMFFVIIQLYQRAFAQMNASRVIRRTATALLAGIALFSYVVVQRHRSNLSGQFAVELGQNLHFLGVLLTYLLWGAIFKIGEVPTRLAHFVLALGIYFSGTAGSYALRNLFPSLYPIILQWVPQIAGTWLPLAWAYTFFKVPQDALLPTARLTAKDQ